MIIEMRPIVANILATTPGLTQFSTSYPSDWSQFPMAIYKATRSPSFKDSHGNEIRSKWTITIEIYSDNVSPTSISNHIEKEFAKIGFIGDSQDANTGNLKRRICEFKGIIDNQLRTVHTSTR